MSRLGRQSMQASCLGILSLNTQSHWVGPSSFAPSLNLWLRTGDAATTDVMLAQETWLYANDTIPHLFGVNYRCAGETRPTTEHAHLSQGTGLLALEKPSSGWRLHLQSQRCPSSRIQTVQLNCNPAIFILNVYGPASGNVAGRDAFISSLLHAIRALGSASFIAIGDWNLNPHALPAQLRRVIPAMRASLLIPPQPTYTPANTTPDFCIARLDGRRRATISNFDKTRLGWHGSAHGAIHVQIANIRPTCNQPPLLQIPLSTRLNPCNTDWDEYERQHSHALAVQNANDMEKELHKSIYDNIRRASKPKRGQSQDARLTPMPETIKTRLEQCRSSHPREYAKIIREWSDQHWKEKKEEWEQAILKHAADSFKCTRSRISGALAKWYSEDANQGPPKVLVKDDEVTSEPTQIANMLAAQFAQVSTGPAPLWPPIPHATGQELQITDQMVSAAITKLADTAAGPDGLQANAFKRAHKSTVCNVTALMQAVFNQGICPDTWKYAEIAPLLKSGKDNLLPVSYRPISLVPMAYRIYGRLLKWLLFDAAAVYLPANQFGFRPLHQAQMQITTLMDLHQRHAPRWTVLLDIAKAYDSVPRDMIISKLISMQVPPKLVRAVQSTLEDTWISVRGGSRWIQTNKGVKQGCVLAPLLFVLFTANWETMANALLNNTAPAPTIAHVPEPQTAASPSSTMSLVFVDDTAITGTNKRDVENTVAAWTTVIEMHALDVNADKCELIAKDHGDSIKVQGRTIPASNSARYLGIFFSSGPDPTRAAIDRKASQCKKLSRLAKVSGLTRKDNLAAVTHQALCAFMEPALEYGCEVWYHAKGGRGLWANWEGLVTGAGPGGGETARIQNGRKSMHSRLILTAVRWSKAVARSNSIASSPFGIVWQNPAPNGCIKALKSLADTVPTGASPKRHIWIQIASSETKSNTLKSYLDYMNPNAKLRMQRGKAPKPMNRALKRGDWTLITTVAANMMPSGTKHSLKHTIELAITLPRNVQSDLRDTCPLCNAAEEHALTSVVSNLNMNNDIRTACIQAWTASATKGTASHIIGTCPAIKRPPSWLNIWHKAEASMASKTPLEDHDLSWFAHRPLRTLHCALQTIPCDKITQIRSFVAEYAKACTDSPLIV